MATASCKTGVALGAAHVATTPFLFSLFVCEPEAATKFGPEGGADPKVAVIVPSTLPVFTSGNVNAFSAV